jgi:site-specific DNA-methyltransferase (adenine-specific)
MKKLPDNCINMMITDPPFNKNFPYESYDDNLSEKDFEDFLTNTMLEIDRVVKNGPVVIFFRENLHVLFHAINPTHLKFRCFLHWYHPNNQLRTSFKLFNRITSAFLLSKEKLEPNHKVVYENILRYEALDTRKSEIPIGEHQCPMPYKLYQQIVEGFSKPGDIVMDPFLGSGTTLAACKASNRIGVGFEICPEYEQVIIDRMNQPKNAFEIGEAEALE